MKGKPIGRAASEDLDACLYLLSEQIDAPYDAAKYALERLQTLAKDPSDAFVKALGYIFCHFEWKKKTELLD